MWSMIWPIAIVVASNTIYNIVTKSTPNDINPFASLAVSYAVATAFSFLMFMITGEQKNIITELSKANVTTYILGIAIVGLEFGYLCIYRAGWKVSTASLVANISLACVLLIVGILIYHESITLKQAAGMALCAAGLIHIVK